MVSQHEPFVVPAPRGTAPGRSGRRRQAARSWTLERLEARSLLSTGPGLSPHHDHRPRANHDAVSEVGNIVYENLAGRQERLDLYLPQGTPPPGGWPVLLAIHGGGWRRFSKDEYGPSVAAMFTPAGIAVVAMNYQLSSRAAPSWPANFEDVRNAARWARANAGVFDLNPNRFAAIGESAGGHLAALLGTNPDGPITAGGDPLAGDVYGPVSAQVQAVVDFYGPTDLAALDAESPLAALAIEQFLGGTPAQLPQTYRDASPVDHVTPSSPPMMLLQGTADTLVTTDQPRVLGQALSNDGVPNRVIFVPGAPHGFEFQASGRKFLPQILAFLHAVWQG
jgi:acetyl esterase/lipase